MRAGCGAETSEEGILEFAALWNQNQKWYTIITYSFASFSWPGSDDDSPKPPYYLEMLSLKSPRFLNP